MHEIRRIGNTICVDGNPVADFCLRKNGTERGMDWVVWRETWICGDTIYCDNDPLADIRPTAKPFERDALARWLDPKSFWPAHRHRIGSFIHQSHFASEASSHMVAGL